MGCARVIGRSSAAQRAARAQPRVEPGVRGTCPISGGLKSRRKLATTTICHLNKPMRIRLFSRSLSFAGEPRRACSLSGYESASQASDSLQYCTHLATSFTGVGARWNPVFQLDVGVDRPLLLLEQLQDFLDRRLALAPGEIAASGGAVFQVQADDLVVVFLNDRDRRFALGAGDVVSDVEIEADVLRRRSAADRCPRSSACCSCGCGRRPRSCASRQTGRGAWRSWSLRSVVMALQPRALAISKLKSMSSSVGPKGNLWMWMLTPASLYILRSCAHLASCDSRSLARSASLTEGDAGCWASLPAPPRRPRSRAAATRNSGEGADGAVHQLRLAQAILQEALERVLGGIGPPR